MKSIPTISIDKALPVPFGRNKAAMVLRFNRGTRQRIDGMLTDGKTYAVNYFTTTATIKTR